MKEPSRATNGREPEIYTDERIAEFLLSNAVDAEDYADSVAQVKAMGLDPNKILHVKPE